MVYWGVYAGIQRIPTSRFFWQRILTSVIINKQGTFRQRPFATPLCVYPPPFLAIHHWYTPQYTTAHNSNRFNTRHKDNNSCKPMLVFSTMLYRSHLLLSVTCNSKVLWQNCWTYWQSLYTNKYWGAINICIIKWHLDTPTYLGELWCQSCH